MEFDLNIQASRLIVNGEAFYGVNILEKLKALEHIPEAKRLLTQVAFVHTQPHIPRLGFHLTSSRAVLPTKRIIDVGYDLTVVDEHSHPTRMTTLYETDVALQIPLGYYVELVPRSSLSKTGYVLANSVGIIDPSYTGTIKIPLMKVDPSTDVLALPARVAQLILKPYVYSEAFVAEAAEQIQTTRGANGFGST